MRLPCGEFEVHVADGGVPALAMLLEGLPVDVIISDVMMPDLSGPELYQKVVAQLPALADAFIFMSGKFVAASGNNSAPLLRGRRLDKPASAQAIRDAVWEVVNARLHLNLRATTPENHL